MGGFFKWVLGAFGVFVLGSLGISAYQMIFHPDVARVTAEPPAPVSQPSGSMLATEGAEAPMKPRPITTAAEIADENALNAARLAAADAAPEADPPTSDINTRRPSDDQAIRYLASVGKQALEAQLRDASSATYRNIIVTRNSVTKGMFSFCGEVNSRNGFGGYSGFEQFVIVGRDVDFAPSNEFAERFKTYCVDAVPVARFDF